MAYIGKTPTLGNFQVCDAISVVNGQAAYTLQVGSVNVIPESANHMLVSLNGILQKSGSSFTVSGSTMTFASNLATGDVIDFVQILGNVLDIGAPSDATVTTAKLADNNVTTAKLAYNPNPNRNIIINGDMSIAQRGTSVSVSDGSNEGYQTCDRWSIYLQNTGSVYTWSQDTDVPTGQGFAKSMKFDVTTADTSLASNEEVKFETKIEGQNLQYLKYGTSSAEQITLSFWVKTNKTGVYVIKLFNRDSSRDVSGSYTVADSNWNKHTITFPADTSGSFGNDNGSALEIQWWLAAGSAVTGGSLNTSWRENADTGAASGQVNFADSTSNNFYITGVQLEAGTSASDFEFLPVDINLARCQRYFHKWVSEHVYANITIGKVQNVKNARGVYQNKVQFRSSPSLSADGNFRMVAGGVGTGTGSDIAVIRNNTYVQFLDFVFSGGSDSTVNQACEMGANNDADAEISFSAEL